jgi:hypothetical protein
MKTYLVRQYRPAYFSGFTDLVCRDVEYDDITKVSWCDNFKHGDFSHFTVEPYHGDELIVEAHYASGKHHVVGFALPSDSQEMAPDGGRLCDNWRYKEHES